MKTVVCFGDSNTWGYVPGSAKRYPFERRWTSVLERELGAGFRVVPEGLNGRTTVFEDPVSGDKCGYSHLRTVLESHKPIDLLIIMLGTNDLKDRFSLSAAEIAKAVGRLLDLALKSGAGLNQKVLSVLLISPPPISHAQSTRDEFLHGVSKSHLLKETYEAVAAEYGVPVYNAAELTSSSRVDGIHWSAEGHELFGAGIADLVRKLS